MTFFLNVYDNKKNRAKPIPATSRSVAMVLWPPRLAAVPPQMKRTSSDAKADAIVARNDRGSNLLIRIIYYKYATMSRVNRAA